MTKKIQIMGLCILCLLMTACYKPSPENPTAIQVCTNCRTNVISEVLLNKSCECISKNNDTMQIIFNISELYQDIPIKYKIKMAKISNHWYCICNSDVEQVYCEQLEACSTNIVQRNINRISDVIFQY